MAFFLLTFTNICETICSGVSVEKRRVPGLPAPAVFHRKPTWDAPSLDNNAQDLSGP